MCVQSPDEILLNGKRTAIEPLSIVENESVAYVPEDALATTADARGYVAYWAVIGEKLYLVETKGCYRIHALGPVFADWVSGIVRPPDESYMLKEENFSIRVENGLLLR